MKPTFTFREHQISVKHMQATPYFCARDMALACGYKSCFSMKGVSPGPVFFDSMLYVSLHAVHTLLSRRVGPRRQPALDLLAALQREFVVSIPVPEAPVSAAPMDSVYARKIKMNQLAMECDELRSEACHQEAEIYDRQKQHKQTLGKLYERERELEFLKSSRVADINVRMINHG